MSRAKKITSGVLAATAVTGVAVSGDATGLGVLLVVPPAMLLALATLAWSGKDRLRQALVGTMVAAVGVWLRYFYLVLVTIGCDTDSSCYADRGATASAWESCSWPFSQSPHRSRQRC